MVYVSIYGLRYKGLLRFKILSYISLSLRYKECTIFLLTHVITYRNVAEVFKNLLAIKSILNKAAMMNSLHTISETISNLPLSFQSMSSLLCLQHSCPDYFKIFCFNFLPLFKHQIISLY